MRGNLDRSSGSLCAATAHPRDDRLQEQPSAAAMRHEERRSLPGALILLCHAEIYTSICRSRRPLRGRLPRGTHCKAEVQCPLTRPLLNERKQENLGHQQEKGPTVSGRSARAALVGSEIISSAGPMHFRHSKFLRSAAYKANCQVHAAGRAGTEGGAPPHARHLAQRHLPSNGGKVHGCVAAAGGPPLGTRRRPSACCR